MTERLRSRIVTAFTEALGPDLTALYAYGSAVDGSFLVGFSDFDIAAFCRGKPTLDSYVAIHRLLDDVDLHPFDYLQVKYVDVTASPRHELVPGAFEVLWGGLGDESSYVFTDESLRVESEHWLSAIPALAAGDAETWSIAVGSARRRRHVRLIITRVKPAVRSALTRLGEPPVKAFTASWDALPLMMAGHDEEAASQLAELRSLLPPVGPESERRAAELGLGLLSRLCPGGTTT